jgi:hypothetical protein
MYDLIQSLEDNLSQQNNDIKSELLLISNEVYSQKLRDSSASGGNRSSSLMRSEEEPATIKLMQQQIGDIYKAVLGTSRDGNISAQNTYPVPQKANNGRARSLNPERLTSMGKQRTSNISLHRI